MNNVNEKELLAYLKKKNLQYMISPAQSKAEIERMVRARVNNLPDDLYLEFNNESASNLCTHDHFENDINKIIAKLERKLQY